MKTIKNDLSEASHQKAIFDWAEMMEVQMPELKLLHSSLGGVRLSIGAAVKAKRLGNKAGVPDIFLPVPRGGKHGLFIELKKIGGEKPRPEQEKWLRDLAEQGFSCHCCFGSESAIMCIISHLNGEVT